ERQAQRAQSEHAPLEAALRRLQVVSLHRHDRRAPPYEVVAVLHAADVAAEVLQWIAQEVPVEDPAPLRPPWFIPRGRLLFVVVLKPPDRVELLQERLACSSGDQA